MAAWAGFSEDELKKVKKNSQQGNVKPKTNRSNCTGQVSPEDERQQTQSSTNNTRTAAKIAKQRTSTEAKTMEHGKERVTKVTTENSQKPAEIVIKTEPMDISDDHIKTEAVDKSEKIQDLDDSEALKHNLKSMLKFREQQKQIEEANKQKKALLAKTLTERKKAAQKEAHKLEHIQKELAKLDTLLTADVQVIRGKIEDASRDFMEAHKRFERAEAEYVAAKMDLHDKQEMKEQLTEHLYTIIHQNEVRKAKKLADLMKTLEMEAEGEEDFSLPELPPLTSFQPSNNMVSPTGSKHIAHEHHTDPSKASDNNTNKDAHIDKSGAESQTRDTTKESDATNVDDISKSSEPSAQEVSGKDSTNDLESHTKGSSVKDNVKNGEMTSDRKTLDESKSTNIDNTSEKAMSDRNSQTATKLDGTAQDSRTMADKQRKVSDSNSPQIPIDLSIVKVETDGEVGVKEKYPVRNTWNFDVSLK